MNDDMKTLRDGVVSILLQPGIPATQKLHELRALFGLPPAQRGRPPLGGERLPSRAAYLRQRRKMLSKLRRCWACEKPNDRHPKTRCARCAEKCSARYRKQRIMQNLESNP